MATLSLTAAHMMSHGLLTGLAACDCAVTPPGYKTIITGDTGSTTECAPGEYRAEWKPPGAASSCSVCGQNIDSAATEEITSYAVTPDAKPTKVFVRASASSCSKSP